MPTGGRADRMHLGWLRSSGASEQLLDAALSVIVAEGYGGVSIEAVARTAGVTRPVVYDHFPNLGRLLHALVEREERCALEQFQQVVPDAPGDLEPAELLVGGVR